MLHPIIRPSDEPAGLPSAPPRGAVGRRGLLAGAGLAVAGIPASGARAERVGQILIGSDGWIFASYDPLAIVDTGKIRRVAALMGEAGTILRGAGITLAVSIAPARARTYRDKLPPDVRITREVDGRYALALREMRAARLLVPDTAAVFERRRREAPDVPLFFKTDSHWTPEGAEAAAADMAALLATLRLPASAAPGSALPAPERMEHVADLASQLPSDRRRALGRETFNVRRPELITGSAQLSSTDPVAVPPGNVVPGAAQGAARQAALQAALAEENADVAVIGSSYVHPRYGYSLRLSHEMRRPVGLTWAVHQNGPWRTFLSHLSGDGFRARRPKVIVWNILELDIEGLPERNDLWRGNAMAGPAFLAEVRRAVGA